MEAQHLAQPQDLADAIQAELDAQRPVPPEVETLVACPHGTTQDVLRRAMRHQLDLQIRPMLSDGEKQVPLSNAEMKAIYTRRRAHMIGYRNSLAWAIMRIRRRAPLPTPRIAYMFWQSTGDAPRRLPRSFAEGLESCVGNSGLTAPWMR